MRRITPLALVLLIVAQTPSFARIGGPKTIPVDASGNIPGEVASAQMGTGGAMEGVTKIVVPVIAVAFESSAQAKTTHSGGGSLTTRSLQSQLKVDDKTFQSICAQLQAIVEQELTKEGFALLPPDSVDHEARYTGITKDGQPGVEVGDNFMSGFMGNGVKNRWFTAGNRPFFGTGAQGALGETSALIHLARESGKTLLFYRFKIQFTEIDAKNNLFFSSVKGKNLLHIVSADMAVFTPANTRGAMVKLNANATAGTDFIQESRELDAGRYEIVANPERYEGDSLVLIKAVSRQFAHALRKAQGK